MARVASKLATSGQYEAAFALRWIALEGLIVRAAVKALWMRGAAVQDAEMAVPTLQIYKVTKLLKKCCGVNSSVNNDVKAPILKFVEQWGDHRNLLFHQLEVGRKKDLEKLSEVLKKVLEQPRLVFAQMKVDVGAPWGILTLGDPLEDLRQKKRQKCVTKRAIQELITFRRKDTELPKVPDDELSRLFAAHLD